MIRRSGRHAGKHARGRSLPLLRRKGLVGVVTAAVAVVVVVAVSASMATGCGGGGPRAAARTSAGPTTGTGAAPDAAPHAAADPALVAYTAPGGVEVTYSVHSRGDVGADLDRFARQVRATLHDPRGWTLGGRIGFRRVDSGGDMHIVLASSSVVEAAADGCSHQYSCRVGKRILINEHRWVHGTRSWSKSLRAYRHYVINHEVGHFLGLSHRHCAKPDAPAPVMQQQSISLEGCRSNVWPRLSELRAAARHQDVSVPARSPRASRADRDGPAGHDRAANRRHGATHSGPTTLRAPASPPPSGAADGSGDYTHRAPAPEQSGRCVGEGFLERLAEIPGDVF